VATYSSFGSGDQRPRVNELGHVLVGRAEVSINSTDIAKMLLLGQVGKAQCEPNQVAVRAQRSSLERLGKAYD
jgi:hypothetical protein